MSIYSPEVLSLVEHPVWDEVAYAACNAATTVLEPISMQQVGWVSLGGALLGADADGCNPLLEPCHPELVPVKPATWGAIKQRY